MRDKEFEKELERREKEIEQKGESALTIIRMEQEKSYNEELFRKNDEIADKEREIERLKSQLEKVNVEKKFAISEAVQTKEKELSEKVMEITELKGQLSSKETERQLKEKSLKEQYEVKLKNKDEQIEYYKDFKKPEQDKEFTPGDRISYASRVYDEKEMMALTDATLDFWLTTGRFSDQFEKEFAD